MNKKQITSISNFKQLLQVGTKVHTIFHKEFDGRDEKGNVIYKTIDKGIREVSIKQTNSFALKTTKTDGKIFNSWCEYPKASEVVIEDNSLHIYETERDGSKSKVLTYSIIN